MLTVIYDGENGYSTTDKKAKQFVSDIVRAHFPLDDQDAEVVVGTELLIAHFRLAVKEGRISHTRIQIKYGDQIIPFDVKGRLNSWPKGFCDEHLDVLTQL